MARTRSAVEGSAASTCPSGTPDRLPEPELRSHRLILAPGWLVDRRVCDVFATICAIAGPGLRRELCLSLLPCPLPKDLSWGDRSGSGTPAVSGRNLMH